MNHGFILRPHTQDGAMFDSVVKENEYQLPDSLADCKLVVDIGLNIGSFSYAALSRGAMEVHGYEPDAENVACARENLRQFGDRVHIHHAAIWRSDVRDRMVTLNFPDPAKFGCDGALTACGHVSEDTGGTSVPTIAFDDMVLDVTKGGRRRINLLKIDCEGAEYPILFTSRKLHLVDLIVGEYHNIGVGLPVGHPFHRMPEEAKVKRFSRYTCDEIVDFLYGAGFQVSLVGHPTIPDFLGHFFAQRQSSAAVRLRQKIENMFGRTSRKRAS